MKAVYGSFVESLDTPPPCKNFSSFLVEIQSLKKKVITLVFIDSNFKVESNNLDKFK